MKKPVIYTLLGMGIVALLYYFFVYRAEKAKATAEAAAQAALGSAINNADEAGYTELMQYIKTLPKYADWSQWWLNDLPLYFPGGDRQDWPANSGNSIFQLSGKVLKTARLSFAMNEINAAVVPEWAQPFDGQPDVPTALFNKYKSIRAKIAQQTI